MAELLVDGDDVVLHLSRLEEFEAIRGDLRAPLASVSSIEVLDNAHQPADQLLKRIGGRLPGIFEVGSFSGDGVTVFAAVHHDTPRGLLIQFQGANFDAWIVGCADPEAVKRQLSQG